MDAKARANLRLQLSYGGRTLMDNSDLLALLDICDEAEMVTSSATPQAITSVADDIRQFLSEVESIAFGLRTIQERCGI